MAYLPEVDVGAPFQPFAALREGFGFVPNVFRAQTLAPALVQTEVALVEALLLRNGALSRIQKECLLLTLAAASECVLHQLALRDTARPRRV